MSEIPDRPFGVDVRLAGSADGGYDGRIVSTGDLATVQGNDAAVQALTLRLLVRCGELSGLGWPDYGSRLYEVVGERDVARTRLQIAQYAREAVMSDPRVQEVEEVAVSTNQVEARVAVSLLLVGGESVRVAVSVPIGAP